MPDGLLQLVPFFLILLKDIDLKLFWKVHCFYTHHQDRLYACQGPTEKVEICVFAIIFDCESIKSLQSDQTFAILLLDYQFDWLYLVSNHNFSEDFLGMVLI